MKENGMKEKQAEKLAEFFHCGQKRRDGEDFIEHPRRVAKAIKDLGYDEDLICASWLHDLEDFRFLGVVLPLIDKVFGYKVFGLVLLLTHVPKGMPYNDYIYNIAKTSNDAMVIKWQDMIDNTTDHIPERQSEKYRGACSFLHSKGIEIPGILKERLKID